MFKGMFLWKKTYKPRMQTQTDEYWNGGSIYRQVLSVRRNSYIVSRVQCTLSNENVHCWTSTNSMILDYRMNILTNDMTGCASIYSEQQVA